MMSEKYYMDNDGCLCTGGDEILLEEACEDLNSFTARIAALEEIRKAARRFCMRPGCGHVNEAMSLALDAYTAKYGKGE